MVHSDALQKQHTSYLHCYIQAYWSNDNTLLQLHSLPLAIAISNNSTAQQCICSHTQCSVWASLTTWSCWPGRAKTIATSSAIEAQCALAVIEIQLSNFHIDFQGNRNMNYAFNITATVEPTKTKRKDSQKKLAFLLQRIQCVPL